MLEFATGLGWNYAVKGDVAAGHTECEKESGRWDGNPAADGLKCSEAKLQPVCETREMVTKGSSPANCSGSR